VANGEYTIRVYLMRNAARRNESATYTLDIGVSRDAKKWGAAAPAAAAIAASLTPVHLYPAIQTTAVCSPTRAALITGRNHHSAHTGVCDPEMGVRRGEIQHLPTLARLNCER
jgi:hypothetical protein